MTTAKLTVLFHFQTVLHGAFIFCCCVIPLLAFRTSQNNIVPHNSPLTEAHDQDWTGDLILTKDVLYQLSYVGTIYNDNFFTNPPTNQITKNLGAGNGIRTSVGSAGRFTVCSLWPLGNPSSQKTYNQSWRWDSNPQPADYKSAALPVELRQPLRNT